MKQRLPAPYGSLINRNAPVQVTALPAHWRPINNGY
jgi:hypothetical protein